MNSLQSTKTKISSLLSDLEVVEPFTLANKLAGERVIPADKVTETAAIILTTPTSLFLYDGVRLFIQKILYSGSDVVLWTQGDPQLQKAKCDTSGLLQLAEPTTGRIDIAPAIDKITLLGGLLSGVRVKDKKRLVFIDDKSSQLFRTYQDLLKLREVDHKQIPKEILYIWLRKDKKTKDVFPSGFPTLAELTEFIKGKFTTASSIEELPVLAKSLYLIDFDRTLFDSEKWFQTVQERIATEICLAR